MPLGKLNKDLDRFANALKFHDQLWYQRYRNEESRLGEPIETPATIEDESDTEIEAAEGGLRRDEERNRPTINSAGDATGSVSLASTDPTVTEQVRQALERMDERARAQRAVAEQQVEVVAGRKAKHDRAVQVERHGRRLRRYLAWQYLSAPISDADLTELTVQYQHELGPIFVSFVRTFYYLRILIQRSRQFSVTPLGKVYTEHGRLVTYQAYPITVKDTAAPSQPLQPDTPLEIPGLREHAQPAIRWILAAFLPKAFRAFQPELERINRSARAIKLRNLGCGPDPEGQGLHIARALVAGHVDVLVEWCRSFASPMGRYGAALLLSDTREFAPIHVQFTNTIGDLNALVNNLRVILQQRQQSHRGQLHLTSPDQAAIVPDLSDLYTVTRNRPFVRQLEPTRTKLISELTGTLDMSVAVGLTVMRKLAPLKRFLRARGLLDMKNANGYQNFRWTVLPVMADHYHREDDVVEIIQWYQSIPEEADACSMTATVKYMGWSVRTPALRAYVAHCSGRFVTGTQFLNDLPLFIDSDDDLAWLMYDHM
ncbi:hypothetical protein IWQ60_009702 [Tieghemiomyces parasiticus]|uniref:Uncharacterized protein n=1 Tax=Tieghemiomyces parasiticus TaxID=78921 RepID=A0A9W7ZSV6_9FUNG|nr:hypothetical protein IWQ60_009702 [Tieghemiomyces parasiticus]